MKDLIITDVKEVREDWYVDFYFNANGSEYLLHVVEGFDEHSFRIEEIVHNEQKCRFCETWEENTPCEVLQQHKKEILQEIIKHSKDRLRWMTREIS